MKLNLIFVLIISFFLFALRGVYFGLPKHINPVETSDSVEFHQQHAHDFLTNVQTVFFGIFEHEHEHSHNEDLPMSHSHNSKTHSHTDFSQLKIDFAHVNNFINILELPNQLFGLLSSRHHHFEFATKIFRPPIFI